MTKYYAMSSDAALRFLTARDNGEAPLLEEFQTISGEGAMMGMAAVNKLRGELRELKRQFPESLRERDQEGGRFEQEACAIVHQCLGSCDEEMLANLDFWTWLAVAKFADIVEWRFGAHDRHAKPANYGVAKRTENLLFRLWLRAELARDDKAKDAYHLARTGDQDLWRSHILRQGYANARLVATTLLRLQSGQLKAKRLAVEGIRELAKRLKRLRANVVFEFLDAEQVEGLMQELCSDLKKAKPST